MEAWELGKIQEVFQKRLGRAFGGSYKLEIMSVLGFVLELPISGNLPSVGFGPSLRRLLDSSKC